MRNKQAVSLSCISDPVEEAIGRRGIRVIHIEIPKKLRFKALIFLISKMRYEYQSFSESDLRCLYELFSWLESSSSKGTSSNFKYQAFLLQGMLPILKSANKLIAKTIKPERVLWNFPSLFVNKLYDSYQYFGMKNGLFKTINFLVHYRTQYSVTPEVPYIGVGYKDKGSSRLLSSDTSPDWKEIAMDRRTQRTIDRIHYTPEEPPYLIKIGEL